MNQSWYSTLCSFITTISLRVKLNQRLLRFFFTVNRPLREAFAHLADTCHHTQTVLDDYWYNCTIGMYIMYTIISIKLLVIAIARWCLILSWTWLKAGTKSKMDSWTKWLNFVWKLYFIITELFCRYKSDNNMNIAYVNRLQWCPQRLVRKILLDIITPCTKISHFLVTSHPVWHSRPSQSIAT